MSKGLLLVTMQPTAQDEQEFQDWYDTEHLPERAAIDGFLTAQRYVCTSGWPRYMAAYDLSHLDVLREPGYAAISGDRFSPWSKRILARVQGLYRVEGVQIAPGEAIAGDKGKAAWLTMLRFRDMAEGTEPAILAGLNENYADKSDVLQHRLFRSGYDGSNDYLALIELRVPGESLGINASAFGKAAVGLDLVNHYSRYWRHGRLHGVF